MDVNVAGLYQLDGLCQVSAGQSAVGINADFNPSVTPLLHQLLKLLGSQVADGPRTLCMGKMSTTFLSPAEPQAVMDKTMAAAHMTAAAFLTF